VSLVLDGSIALAWCFADETTETIDALMLRVAGEGAVVPAIWRLEIANGLRSGIRRKRLTIGERDRLLADFIEMRIETDTETDRPAWLSTIRLADRYDLTPYDASYLELSLRRSLPLASLDKVLRTAAVASGVTLLGA
jgi:predicted nucleic acid-binding protein